MSLEEIVARLRAHRDELQALGVKDLFLFGSFVRKEAGPGSDLDVAVELIEPVSFDRLMALKLYLEDLLGVPVDVVRLRALKPSLRRIVEREGLRVA
ncbi:hypothetical protein AN926_03010 [Thermus scotoductus]|uniref:Polymerase nucleotidyl transferase domain-containing protein n=1 Tax=Thermus scotoductus TaxID=37636 RepID=A0A0N1KQI7_THESC|nr:nucleotidyltransferase family protein [Thermus sp. NMX2.A1]ETN88622.1 hypothetical protein TNMX_05940 [Thermus sp. NMX2.A1]KPD32411.1 hypothetical protein AN926_03010 [Thermus scotoductus]